MICPQCNKEVKSLSRHTWKAHGPGVNHKPFTGKTQEPWNKGLSKETNESLARVSKQKTGIPSGTKGCRLPEEVKDRISKSMRGNRNAKHRGNQCLYKGHKMDSGWEAKVAAYLDEQQIDWKYEEKAFPLNERRSYRPDFFIYVNGIFSHAIEVKGYWREANLAKFAEFREKYPQIRIEIWDKAVLKERRII